MDVLTDSQFVRLHGQELFDLLVVPMKVVFDEKHYNADPAALVSGKVIAEVMDHFPEIKDIRMPTSSSLHGRESFVRFKKAYIEKYGQPEWDRVYPIMEIAFNWWLQYHQK